jgi:G:T-mismatch repair DNA endonuclease (very short patch repair protein)
MPRENHPSYQPHLDHGAFWAPHTSETRDHRHWFNVPWGDTEYAVAWTDTELNRPVAVIKALEQIGR